MFEIKSLLRQFLSIHWSSNPNYDRFIIHSFTLSNYFFGGLEKSSHIFNNMRSMFSNRHIRTCLHVSFLNEPVACA
ncbi:hypothetical protein LCGC14_0876500, partial [marine sediment metagenome]